MTDDLTSTEPAATIVNFQDFKNREPANDKTSGVNPFPKQTEVPTQRRYFLNLTEDVIEIEGFVGLTGSFLAIGDAAGQVKFAAAQGIWKTILDVTDTDKTLKDYVGGQTK